ncbi:hypothetical protein FHT85_005448 [Rhizobium sp. BK312]|nr:hypothetical protein [Rhizobium sp. BK312]
MAILYPRFLALHLLPVAYFDYKHHEALILQFADNPIITDTVTPQIAQLGSLQGFSGLSRILILAIGDAPPPLPGFGSQAPPQKRCTPEEVSGAWLTFSVGAICTPRFERFAADRAGAAGSFLQLAVPALMVKGIFVVNIPFSAAAF